MKPVLGNLGANTLVILTAAEMAAIRTQLDPGPGQTNSAQHQEAARRAFNAGVDRGTTHMAEEFKALQQAKKQGK